jgi:hypothetical protein
MFTPVSQRFVAPVRACADACAVLYSHQLLLCCVVWCGVVWCGVVNRQHTPRDGDAIGVGSDPLFADSSRYDSDGWRRTPSRAYQHTPAASSAAAYHYQTLPSAAPAPVTDLRPHASRQPPGALQMPSDLLQPRPAFGSESPF